MLKKMQNINLNFVLEISETQGCTDPEAYNCEGSMAGEYVNEIGIIVYDYSCDGNHAGPEDCNEGEICEGYYDSAAETDDGSCRYPQAPQADEVVFIISENGITVNWSAFTPPANAVLVGYGVQQCIGASCLWISGFNPNIDENTSTSVFDDSGFLYDIFV